MARGVSPSRMSTICQSARCVLPEAHTQRATCHSSPHKCCSTVLAAAVQQHAIATREEVCTTLLLLVHWVVSLVATGVLLDPEEGQGRAPRRHSEKAVEADALRALMNFHYVPDECPLISR